MTYTGVPYERRITDWPSPILGDRVRVTRVPGLIGQIGTVIDCSIDATGAQIRRVDLDTGLSIWCLSTDLEATP